MSDATEKRRAYQRDWAKRHYKRLYLRHREKMASDPEYAERYRARMNERNKKRPPETPEQREKRLRRDRENKAKKYRAWRAMNPLVPKEKPAPAPKPETPVYRKPKLGRIAALSRWYKF